MTKINLRIAIFFIAALTAIIAVRARTDGSRDPLGLKCLRRLVTTWSSLTAA